MGVGIEVANLNAWYATNHTLQDINLNIPANHELHATIATRGGIWQGAERFEG